MQELTRSDTAARMGIKNIPDLAAVPSLRALVDRVLDPLREAYGAPINVTSGYRCARLNKAVGGAAGSQHTRGQAADIVPADGDVERLLALARKIGGYDQLIDEWSGGAHWLHISYDRGKVCQRGETLRYKGGKYYRI